MRQVFHSLSHFSLSIYHLFKISTSFNQIRTPARHTQRVSPGLWSHPADGCAVGTRSSTCGTSSGPRDSPAPPSCSGTSSRLSPGHGLPTREGGGGEECACGHGCPCSSFGFDMNKSLPSCNRGGFLYVFFCREKYIYQKSQICTHSIYISFQFLFYLRFEPRLRRWLPMASDPTAVLHKGRQVAFYPTPLCPAPGGCPGAGCGGQASFPNGF